MLRIERRDVVGLKSVVIYGNIDNSGSARKSFVYSSFFARFSVCSFLIRSSCSEGRQLLFLVGASELALLVKCFLTLCLCLVVDHILICLSKPSTGIIHVLK